jgi:hypothetical protein
MIFIMKGLVVSKLTNLPLLQLDEFRKEESNSWLVILHGLYLFCSSDSKIHKVWGIRIDGCACMPCYAEAYFSVFVVLKLYLQTSCP